MNEIKELYRSALVYLKKKNRCTIAELAKAANCSTRHIQGVLSEVEKKGLGSESGQMLAEKFGLSYKDFLSLGQWILDGNSPNEWAPPMKSTSFQGSKSFPGQNLFLGGQEQEFTAVPKYKAKLSGGNGSLVTEDQIDANLIFRTEFLQKKGQVNQMALFEVTGESMVPFIHDKDVVLVDMSINTHEQIIDGKAFAYREGDTIKIKRLSRQGKNIIASSENFAIYPPYVIEAENFQLIGRVVWVGHEVY